jgi:hypothetical protein
MTDKGRLAARHLVAMGTSLTETGKGRQAAALVCQTLAAAPDDPALREAAAIVLQHKVPAYHLPMLADARRNAAYRRGIEAHARGKIVLDIGAGSGLLAMIAARAGAAHVYTAEKNGAVAETTREIVALNGYSGRITVIDRLSTALTRDDIGGGADLIVSELFSNDLICEEVLPSLRHARRALGRPGAEIMPRHAAVRIALARFDGRRQPPVGMVEGFDLSPFNRHGKAILNLDGRSSKLAVMGPHEDIFAFDFHDPDIPPEDRAQAVLISSGGRVDGVAQWIWFRFDEATDYENPPGTDSHWAIMFTPFDAPIETKAGERISIHAWRDERHLRLWRAPSG